MGVGLRGCVAAVAAVATYYFVYWLPGSLLLREGRDRLRNAVSLLSAVVVAVFVWRNTSAKAKGPLASMMLGAVLVGSFGFAAGFFGPIVLTPNANQGPLLGLFITGPLGVLVGAVGGRIYWLRHGKGRRQDDDAG